MKAYPEPSSFYDGLLRAQTVERNDQIIAGFSSPMRAFLSPLGFRGPNGIFALVLRRLHDDGLTILPVEQNLAKALEVADRGYVIETGRIKSQGQSEDLLGDDKIRAAYPRYLGR